jgi:hypothetical protein
MRVLVLLASAICVWTLWPGSLAAQDPTAIRARVGEALARGDSATVERAFAELSQMKLAEGNTFWEQTRACGFYPEETRLECVIDIKRPSGYGGPVNSFGSFEFVSFFVDWHSNGFQLSDYVGSGIVQVADGSAGTSFAVYRDFNPPGGPRTSNGGPSANTITSGPLLRARAILSWASPVTNPNGIPVFGNVLNFTIRMLPIR